MSYQIALTFEDGVTRFIECRDEETVADASYRSRINIPLDCRDGVCGTCKSFCESGRYELGEYVPDEAMTEEEEAEGYVLTCQMVPQSDCVVRIFTSSDVAKTGPSAHQGRITANERLSDSTLTFTVELDGGKTLGFLPGQYVNIAVPGTDQTRSYSFSSRPGRTQVSFILRDTPTGALPTFLRGPAEVGQPIGFHGPLGSFYLRDIKRPVLFLAGGTGLAPFTAMLATIDPDSTAQPVHLIYGVTSDQDLVKVDELEEAAKRLPNFSFAYCVADENSTCPNKGYVTRYIEPAHLNGGDVDVYLCGPPVMVEAVRNHFKQQGVTPQNFYYEKFTDTGMVTETGAEHLTVAASDEAFDARLALELGAASLVIGKLTADQLAAYRQLAEATVPYIQNDRFTDSDGFRRTNAAFHAFLIERTGNNALRDTYQRLAIGEYMAEALRPQLAASQQITQDHLDLVAAFERTDLAAAQQILTEHAERSKETMRGGITQAGGT
jgi:benzoate/toluate 1,2-dioxygenase reductase component